LSNSISWNHSDPFPGSLLRVHGRKVNTSQSESVRDSR
jgi:hypothetical protein